MKKVRYLGFFFAAASAVFYGVQPALIRVTYDGGSNGITMTFLRSILALPFLLFLVRRQGETLKLDPGDFRRVLILGAGGSASTTILLYSSYAYIPTGVATTLHFIYPLLVTVGCVIFLREKLTAPKIFALILSTAGIACFMGRDASFHPTGLALALLSGVCYAFFAVYMSASGLKRYHHFKLTFYMCAVVGSCAGLFGAVTGQLTFDLTPEAWLFSLLVALCVGIAANSLFQLGIRYAGPSSTAILSTLEPITSVIVGCLLLGESMTGLKLVGCVCIFSGVILITLAGEKHPENQETAG